MSQRWPGGLIKPTPITPTGPYQDSSASGVWTLDQMEYWLQQGLWPIAGNINVRAVFGGGYSDINVIQYVQIGTLGNTTDFGDLTVGRSDLSACASSTRAVFSGGPNQVPENCAPLLDYITIATTGNAASFGLLNNTSGKYEACGFNSTTRGIFSAGRKTDTNFVNSIFYITIATTGNAVSFGQLTVARTLVGGCSSSTRGLTIAGSVSGSKSNVIDYITIASTGNAVDFGDTTQALYALSAASSSTRGLVFGGLNSSNIAQNVIEYLTIASTGNTADFGDLTTVSQSGAATSNSTRAIVAVGADGDGVARNIIEYVTIATTGNSSDFGDLLSNLRKFAATSNGNGGLQ